MQSYHIKAELIGEEKNITFRTQKKKWLHCEISLNSFHKHPYEVTATCMFVGLSRFPKKILKRGYIYKWEILH